jgi:Alcohol dehydrogenase GroES-like domain
MKTMPAVVLTAEREIALEERPRPALRSDQVIVEVELCGICGSDLHSAQMPQATSEPSRVDSRRAKLHGLNPLRQPYALWNAPAISRDALYWSLVAVRSVNWRADWLISNHQSACC